MTPPRVFSWKPFQKFPEHLEITDFKDKYFYCKRWHFVNASHLLLRSAYFLKPYLFCQLPGFASNFLISMMKDVIVLILSTFQQRNYFPTMQIYGFPVSDPLSSPQLCCFLLVTGSLCNGMTRKTDCQCKKWLLVKFSSTNQRIERGINSGRKLPQNKLSRCLINTLYFLGLINLWHSWGNIIIRLKKKYKELNILVKRKQSNIILLLVVYRTDNHKQLPWYTGSVLKLWSNFNILNKISLL